MLLGYFSVAIGVGADDSATVLGRAVNYTVSPKTYHSCLGHISGKCRPIFKKKILYRQTPCSTFLQQDPHHKL